MDFQKLPRLLVISVWTRSFQSLGILFKELMHKKTVELAGRRKTKEENSRVAKDFTQDQRRQAARERQVPSKHAFDC